MHRLSVLAMTSKWALRGLEWPAPPTAKEEAALYKKMDRKPERIRTPIEEAELLVEHLRLLSFPLLEAKARVVLERLRELECQRSSQPSVP
jgi:hypothetical protein